jgi:hypothetical protein
VQPIINLLRDHLLDSDLIYGDETTVQVLKEPGRQAQSKSFMWAQMNGSGPPVRLFAYAPGRGTVHAQKLYAGIRPFVVGRRSWLFADTVGGANASANLYSLIETARANGVERRPGSTSSRCVGAWRRASLLRGGRICSVCGRSSPIVVGQLPALYPTDGRPARAKEATADFKVQQSVGLAARKGP